MEAPLAKYRRIVGEQPICDEGWFTLALARHRSGDEAAAREISGSCLRYALKIADQRATAVSDVPLFDFIEEANGGLMEAITSFQGSAWVEFLQYAEQKINERLTLLV